MDIFGIKSLCIALLIFMPLERVFTLRTEQKIFRAGWLNDAVYALANGALTKSFLILVIAGSMALGAWVVPAWLTAAVQNQPVWLQVIEIILIGDAGVYAAHRAFHAVPFLWRFHAIHHSIEELDWLAANRVHPVDQIVTRGAALAPVFLLGFSLPAIGIFALIYHGHALLLHANVRLNFGPLKWIVASPQFHHWHHGNDPKAYNKNFSSQLAFIDVLFGTFHVPGKELPKSYGIDEPTPSWYLPQLVHPFMPRGNAAAPPASLECPRKSGRDRIGAA